MLRLHRDLGGNGAFETEHEGKVELKKTLADRAVLLILDDVWRRSDVDWFDVLGPRCRALDHDSRQRSAHGAGRRASPRGAPDRREALSLLATAAGIPREQLPPEAARRRCRVRPLATGRVAVWKPDPKKDALE